MKVFTTRSMRRLALLAAVLPIAMWIGCSDSNAAADSGGKTSDALAIDSAAADGSGGKSDALADTTSGDSGGADSTKTDSAASDGAGGDSSPGDAAGGDSTAPRADGGGCKVNCDCTQSMMCTSGGLCVSPTKPVYCCTKPGCPAGSTCTKPDGSKSTCPATGGCKVDCDCTQGLMCASGRCIAGIVPVYCCTKAGCPSGKSCSKPDGSKSTCP